MTMLRQILTVSLLNFRNLRQRLWQSLVIVLGMAFVSGVLLSMLSMTEGPSQRLSAQRRSAQCHCGFAWHDLGKITASVPRNQASIIMAAPGIARDAK